MSVDNLQQHEALIAALMDPRNWPDTPDLQLQRIDTHISSVVLAGAFAYKIKKPIDLGFLDFLTLQSRQRWCREELRLNSRTAGDIYLAVCPVTGSIEAPRIDGDGEVIDWAVKMRRFDPHALLANHSDSLDAELATQLAEHIGHFHMAAAIARDPDFGSPETVVTPMRQNFEQLRQQGIDNPALQDLSDWTEQAYAHLEPTLEERHDSHHVRECHGDLHLGNIALIDGRPVIFDAIEFNADLRWIDPINDIAFLAMDLHKRGRGELVNGLLDRYLAITGDYQGLRLLQFYSVYRALVRAKVAGIRLAQSPGDAVVQGEIDDYIALAGRLARGQRGAIVITHGPSGSGKSWVTEKLPWQLPLIRVRSDVERKRLLSLSPQQDAAAHGGYSPEMTERTYARLQACAAGIVASGHIALLDATFLEAERRDRVKRLADALQVPFVILDCDAPREVLVQRILERQGDNANVSDAGVAVLDAQLASRESLTTKERELSLNCRPQQSLDLQRLRQRLGVE